MSSSSSSPNTSNSNTKPTVLITGAFGFLGAHAVIQCLASNYKVKATVRSRKQNTWERTLKEEAKKLGWKPKQDTTSTNDTDSSDDLCFITLDLSSPHEEWVNALKDCDYCLHLAANVVTDTCSNPIEEILIPTVDGTERVVRACLEASSSSKSSSSKLKRLIVCSSCTAMGWGRPDLKTVLTEQDWTQLNGLKEDKSSSYTYEEYSQLLKANSHLMPYEVAKTLSELRAWEMVEEERSNFYCTSLELFTILPSAIWGPPILPRMSPTAEAVTAVLSGDLFYPGPILPNISLNIVDVRDVARCMVASLKVPPTRTEKTCYSPDLYVRPRYISCTGTPAISFKSIVRQISNSSKPLGYYPMTNSGPYWLFYLASFFNMRMRYLLPTLVTETTPDSERGRLDVSKTEKELVGLFETCEGASGSDSDSNTGLSPTIFKETGKKWISWNKSVHDTCLKFDELGLLDDPHTGLSNVGKGLLRRTVENRILGRWLGVIGTKNTGVLKSMLNWFCGSRVLKMLMCRGGCGEKVDEEEPSKLKDAEVKLIEENGGNNHNGQPRAKKRV